MEEKNTTIYVVQALVGGYPKLVWSTLEKSELREQAFDYLSRGFQVLILKISDDEKNEANLKIRGFPIVGDDGLDDWQHILK